MKKHIVILFLFMGFIGYSQQSQSPKEDVVGSQNAEFPGGDEAFTKEFLEMIHAYIDLKKYAVNGKFVFVFDVSTNGKVDNLDVLPKVKNSEMFIDDMRFAIKKVKKKWKPAMKDGQPVVSKKIIKINFTSDHFDHGD
ncbi:energy transducer TonB [Chryseobacterium jejuense]|uniref:Gram-negative bacterial tonB protein n=1 Tax=Chryseobacterium jejuense TaxID=445960 RepID=A0A2X2VSP2_CHRJE|nr:energy transducer TonB [Chryseobacterium jejuense]SDJ70887.1 TonB protein C-terminal [Chryseobacterium jejuense]SQB26505.1 Gram-negative bacterial tonB protein [Chryseobacterium jejuense]